MVNQQQPQIKQPTPEKDQERKGKERERVPCRGMSPMRRTRLANRSSHRIVGEPPAGYAGLGAKEGELETERSPAAGPAELDSV